MICSIGRDKESVEKCNCSNEEVSKQQTVPSTSSSESSSDSQDLQGFALLEIQLSKAALNFLPESGESSCSYRKISETHEEQEKIVEDLSHTSETLKTCTCSETCDSLGAKRTSGLGKNLGDNLEYTLAIIKPEAMIYRVEIERLILNEGFSVCWTRWLQLTPEQVLDFYFDQSEKKDFPRLVPYMSSGPIFVMVIAKINAIEEWKLLVGPTKVSDARVYAPDSIRSKYGKEGDEVRNVVHGSANVKSAEKEIRFFFPDLKLETILKEEIDIEYLWKEINDVLLEGLVKCCEEKPKDPITWLGYWLLDNNPMKPKYFLRH